LMAKIQFHYNVIMGECGVMRLIKLMRITDDCQVEENRIKQVDLLCSNNYIIKIIYNFLMYI
jgi:hypothetical protein